MYGKDVRRLKQYKEVNAIQRKMKHGGRIDHEASIILRHFTVSTQQYIEGMTEYEVETEPNQTIQGRSPGLDD